MILMAHMTRLAKADQIAADVGQVSGREKAERHDVVDWKALADMASAFGAPSILIGDDCCPRQKPPAPAICPGSANPIWRGITTRSRRIATGGRAKAGHAVLFRQPRFLPKGRSAVAACKVNASLPSVVGFTPDIFWAEGICWTLSRAKLIARQMRLGGSVQEGSRLPSRSARCAAKARPISPVRFNAKCRLANFAGLFDHVESIPETGIIGKRTTLIACRRVDEATRQPDLFITPPAPKPTQETLL